MTMVPMRPNISMKVAASAGRNEMSMRMRGFSSPSPWGAPTLSLPRSLGRERVEASRRMATSSGLAAILRDALRSPSGDRNAPQDEGGILVIKRAHPAAMRAASRVMWLCSRSAMNGSTSIMATKIARILGTKASVISWICVSAWNSEITIPTASPISINGLETRTSVRMASRATSRTSPPVIAAPSLLPARRFARAPRSDRHPHDFLIGLDHPVTDRHQRLDRHLGLRDRGDHIDDVRLARDHPLLRGIRLAASLERATERVLEQRTEARTIALAERLAQSGGRIGEAGKTRIGIGGGGWTGHGMGPGVVRAQAFRMSMVRWIMRRVAPMTLMLAS